MLRRFLNYLAPKSISPPSLWGKVPAYGDFVRHNANAEDIAAWQQWFAAYPIDLVVQSAAVDLDSPALRRKAAGWFQLEVSATPIKPVGGVWSFVLPPGALQPTPNIPANACIVGAMADSCDKVGRMHPVVIWSALPQEAIVHLKMNVHWPYWAARLLTRHVPPISTPDHQIYSEISVQQQLQDMWQESRGTFAPALRLLRKDLPLDMLNSLVEHYLIEPGMPHKQVHETDFGLRDLPWNLWPNRLLGGTPNGHQQAYFWQQAKGGKYLSSAAIDLTGEQAP